MLGVTTLSRQENKMEIVMNGNGSMNSNPIITCVEKLDFIEKLILAVVILMASTFVICGCMSYPTVDWYWVGAGLSLLGATASGVAYLVLDHLYDRVVHVYPKYRPTRSDDWNKKAHARADVVAKRKRAELIAWVNVVRLAGLGFLLAFVACLMPVIVEAIADFLGVTI